MVCPITTVSDLVQVVTVSVTVTVYVTPAVNPVAVCVVCTGEVFQLYVYVPEPPLTVAVAVPLVPAWFVGLVEVISITSSQTWSWKFTLVELPKLQIDSIVPV